MKTVRGGNTENSAAAPRLTNFLKFAQVPAERIRDLLRHRRCRTCARYVCMERRRTDKYSAAKQKRATEHLAKKKLLSDVQVQKHAYSNTVPKCQTARF
jgi:hypothetical protein